MATTASLSPLVSDYMSDTLLWSSLTKLGAWLIAIYIQTYKYVSISYVFELFIMVTYFHLRTRIYNRTEMDTKRNTHSKVMSEWK